VKGYVQANVSSLPIYVTAPSILICSLLYNLYWYRRTRPSSVAVGGYLALQASSETAAEFLCHKNTSTSNQDNLHRHLSTESGTRFFDQILNNTLQYKQTTDYVSRV
jgi:hypothetical protein